MKPDLPPMLDACWKDRQDWIVTATRHLSADAARQVRAEIEPHVEAAIADLLAAGADPASAAEQALASLGSPRVANREYRKILLTASEARMLQEHSGPVNSISRRLAWAMALYFIAMAAYFAIDQNWSSVALVLMVAPSMYFASPHFLFTASDKVPGRLYKTLRILWWLLLVAVVPASLLIPGLPVFSLGPASAMAIVTASQEWRRLTIRRKVTGADRPGWLRF